MKIVVLTDQFPPRVGGMSSHAYYISRYLAREHDVTVIKETQPTKNYSNEPFAILSLITRRFPNFDLVRIYRKLKIIKPDIVHVCTAGLDYRLLSKTYPVLTRVVGNDFLRTWTGFHLPGKYVVDHFCSENIKSRFRNLEKIIRRKLIIKRLEHDDCIITNSNWTKNQLNSRVNHNWVQIITGGVDINRFKPTTNFDGSLRLKKKMRIKRNGIVLLTVANLVKDKNIESVLKAIRLITKKGGKINYIIVGTGELKKKLISLVKQYDIEEQVYFTGKKDYPELLEYYYITDIYIQPSIVESMGRSILEAMACRLPVISSNVGGIPDIVSHLKTGILLDDPLDQEKIVYYINLLITNSELRNKLAINGYQNVKKYYSWEKVGSQIQTLMKKILVNK